MMLIIYLPNQLIVLGLSRDSAMGCTQTQHLVDFLNRAQAIHAPVDFVSSHLYPTDANCTHAGASIDCFAETVRGAASMVAAASDLALPFFLTEYNVGLGVPAADTNGAAAFVIRNAFLLDGVLDVFSYWCFSDLFEEMGLIPIPFHKGYVSHHTLWLDN
jgi:xylan 1,4-beta-xylosidase